MNPVRKKVNEFVRSFEKSFQPLNILEISESAVLHNFDYFKELSQADMLPVLKSNAYGHGLIQIAQILKKRKFPYLAVDGYFEALRIREVTDQHILIMGFINPSNFVNLDYDDFTFVVQDIDTLKAIIETKRKIKIHLEINTGMNRYGINPEELERFIDLIGHNSQIQLEGVMSHLADSDNFQNDFTDKQVHLYDECVKKVLDKGINPRYMHLSQTAGSVKAKSKYCNCMRLGIGLYGINPLSENDEKFNILQNLKPALRLTSTITKVIELRKGEKVSYNGTFTASKDMRIGVLPLGYYEGVNRALSNKGVVKYGDKYLSIVGRVCMNHTMIELGDTMQKGDEVIVISDLVDDENSVIMMQKKYGLFSYETLVKINENIRRKIV